MQSVEQTRSHLQEIVEAYCHSRHITFPADYDGTRYYDNEPGGSNQPYHEKARKSAKQFIPRDEAQLTDFLAANPGIDVSTRREVAALLEALAVEVWRAEFIHQNELAYTRDGIIKDQAQEIAERPILSELEGTSEIPSGSPEQGIDESRTL